MSTWIDKAGRRHVGVMASGRRVHRILPKGAGAGDAKRIEAELRGALASRSPAMPGDPRLSDVMSLYIEHTATLRSPETAIFHARRTGAWLEGRRASEARQACAAMVKDMTGSYAPATINRSLGTVKKALRLAWSLGHTPVDHGALIKRLPEHNRRETYLTVAEVKALADHASENVRAAIWIALLTGCRRGEICKIVAGDIGETTLRIQAGNTKTLRRRDVPIVPALRPWLRFLPLEINETGIKSGFNRAREAAGMPHVNFHDLRHSCASILLAAGVDLYTIAKILGHSSITTTQRYSHLEVEAQRSAMARAFDEKLHRKLHRAPSQAKPKRAKSA